MTTLPITIHPATAHFAIVLPIVAALFGVIYLSTKSESWSKITTRTTLVAALAMIAVWYTGTQAGQQVYDYLSADAKAELLEHKQLGVYLAIAMSIITVIMIIGCKMKNYAIQLIAILALIVAMGTTLYQGKEGGEIAYEHGMPFKAYMIQESLHEAVKNADDTEECDEKVEAYEDAIDDIDSLSEEVGALYGATPKAEETDTDK